VAVQKEVIKMTKRVMPISQEFDDDTEDEEDLGDDLGG
jgi:hypothetical protein